MGGEGEIPVLQINDPLVEKLHAVLVGHPKGAALGAVDRLRTVLNEYYYREEDEQIPEIIRVRVNSTRLIGEEIPCSHA
jgi:hypothetical protein